MTMAPSQPPLRTRNIPPRPRKLNNSLSDGAVSEPSGFKKTSNAQFCLEDDAQAAPGHVAWDWQAKKWLPGTQQLPNRPGSKPPTARNHKQGGFVSDLEGISEREVHTKEMSRSGPRSRDINSTGPRNRRRGFLIIDMQGRPRKVIMNSRRSDSRRELRNPAARNSETNPGFPLSNLEAYLKERGPSSLVKESLGFSPPSRPFSYPRLGDCPSNLSERGMREKPKLFIKTYGSANEVEDALANSDDTEAFHSERSGCGMPWHWSTNSGQRMKNENQSAVDKRKGGRKSRMRYKYSSERSVSSFESDPETIPLMTEPEPFHEYTDDLASSATDLRDYSPRHMHQVSQYQAFSRFKDGGRDAAITSKSGGSQEMVIRKQREAGGIKHRSLSQKYRPKTFKDLIGQSMVSESLSNAILRAKIAPVYLFHGPRGTGKTTAAKIFTTAMNCLSVEELRPCGLCKECTAFNSGQNYDVKQIDAVGNNDVDSMRLLLKHVSLPPSSSRYKVFIVDDCHTLTSEAWNALLKSLEEPPSYVVFILITTDLEHLPRTAISRCQKFMFPRIKDADVVLRLRKIAHQEKVEIEIEALQFIASKADGSFRDAENMLDQLSLLGNRITLATVQEMVGLIPDEKLAKLLELALSADTVSTVNAIRELMESGVEPLALTSQLATLITDILAGKDRVAGNTTMRVKDEDQERLKQALMVLSEAEKQLRSCSDRTTWLTAAFLQFAPKEPCLLPLSSRGTSVTQSPITLVDASGKETPDSAMKRLSWGGDETWHSRSPSRQVCGLQKHMDNHSHHISGPFLDNRIHPCELSPQSGTAVQGRKSAGREKTLQRENGTMSPSTMDSIWRKVIQSSRSTTLKQLLHGKGKLVSLAVTEAFAVASVEFGHAEHKALAEKARPNIANAFQLALGCPVEVEISLSSLPGDCRENGHFVANNVEHHTRHISNHGGQDDGLFEEKRRNRAGSFRKTSSSFRKTAPATSSPLHRSQERRRSRQSFDIEVRTHSRRSTDMSMKDFDVDDREKLKDLSVQDLNSFHHDNHAKERLRSSSKRAQAHKGSANGCYEDYLLNDHAEVCAVEGTVPAKPCMQGNGDANDDDEYGSDSDGISDRDDPGALCWKGARMNNNKGRRRRRRKGRFLLRLVPCAKGGGRN